MHPNNAVVEKEALEQEAVTFDLEKKYPELTNEEWRRALEFTIVVRQELDIYPEQAVALLIALVGR